MNQRIRAFRLRPVCRGSNPAAPAGQSVSNAGAPQGSVRPRPAGEAEAAPAPTTWRVAYKVRTFLAWWVPYRGLLGARNWELIQPFQLGFSTWTQSPSRLVAVNRVPLGAAPRTGAFPEGADLMFTPGRCKKTRSRFGVTAFGATWGEASAVRGAGTSGEGTAPDAPRDGSGTAAEVRMTIALLLEKMAQAH